MKSYNLGLAFYRKYYSKWNFEKDTAVSGLKGVKYPRDENDTRGKEEMQQTYFRLKSKPLMEQKIPKHVYAYSRAKLKHTIPLQTSYPGLLLGTGYTHGIGKQGEHKIGFYFDHTTGLPVIPGSTVKGVLRSVFPMRYQERAEQLSRERKQEEANSYQEEADNRKAYILYLINDQLKFDIDTEDPQWVYRLEAEIFEGIYSQENNNPVYLPTVYRDIFHDAILSSPNNKPFMGDDFITPHKNRQSDDIPDELKNPIPIQFLKVLPGITFTFQFRLLDEYYIPAQESNELEACKRILTASQRRKLFQAILEDIGIGAKTNVGYGQLLDPNASNDRHLNENRQEDHTQLQNSDKRQNRSQSKSHPKKDEDSKGKKPVKPEPKAKAVPDPIKLEKIKRNNKVVGTVLENNGGKIVFQLNVIGYEDTVSITYRASDRFTVNSKYLLKIKTVEGKGPNRKLSIHFPSPNDKI